MSISRQYRSAVFYHDQEQLQAARKKGVKQLEPLGTRLRNIVPRLGVSDEAQKRLKEMAGQAPKGCSIP